MAQKSGATPHTGQRLLNGAAWLARAHQNRSNDLAGTLSNGPRIRGFNLVSLAVNSFCRQHAAQ